MGRQCIGCQSGKIKDLLLVEGHVLILNSTSNPWGCVYDEDELEKFAEEVYKACQRLGVLGCL